jgi:hypothetical protein
MARMLRPLRGRALAALPPVDDAAVPGWHVVRRSVRIVLALACVLILAAVTLVVYAHRTNWHPGRTVLGLPLL